MDMDDHKPQTHHKEQPVESLEDEDDTFSQRSYHGRFGFYHRHSRFLNHLLTFMICTGLFIPAVVIHKEGNILVISLLYAAVVWWLLLQHLPDGTLSRPIALVWNTCARSVNAMPSVIVKTIGYGIPPLALILTAALRADDDHGTRSQRLISCLGLVVLLLITIAFSKVIYHLLFSLILHHHACARTPHHGRCASRRKSDHPEAGGDGSHVGGGTGIDLPFGLRIMKLLLGWGSTGPCQMDSWSFGLVHEDVLQFLPLPYWHMSAKHRILLFSLYDIVAVLLFVAMLHRVQTSRGMCG